jgi:prepilin-type N-terminal cleavage/methylation domain-containing protein
MTMRRIAGLARREDGMSLVELLVAMMILGIVAAVFATTLSSVQRVVSHTDSRTQNNTQARLAIEELDREIRSGNVLYDPGSGADANYRFKIYTQSNAPTRDPAPGYVCRLWRITSTYDLQTRFWPPTMPLDATDWRTVATGVVNRALTPAVPAFALDPDPNKGGRTVNIVLMMNNDLANRPNETLKVQSALTGRNTSYGFPVSVCNDEPAD